MRPASQRPEQTVSVFTLTVLEPEEDSMQIVGVNNQSDQRVA